MHCFNAIIVTLVSLIGNFLLIMMTNFQMRFLKGHVEIVGRLNLGSKSICEFV
jgi:hypothetical protein